VYLADKTNRQHFPYNLWQPNGRLGRDRTMPTAEESLNQAWNTHQAGDVAGAERVYRQVVAAQPNHAAAWCYLGMACHDQDRFEEAIAAYQRAVELKPDLTVAFNNLGNTYRLMHRLD